MAYMTWVIVSRELKAGFRADLGERGDSLSLLHCFPDPLYDTSRASSQVFLKQHPLGFLFTSLLVNFSITANGLPW